MKKVILIGLILLTISCKNNKSSIPLDETYTEYYNWYLYCWLNNIDVNCNEDSVINTFLDVFCEMDDADIMQEYHYYIIDNDTISIGAIINELKEVNK